MKKLILAIAAFSIGLGATPMLARGGVTINQETTVGGNGGPRKDTRTVMVQGNKQKIVMPRQTVIIDLDKGSMMMIDPAGKTYAQIAFPPTGPMASMMQSMGSLNVQFKKTNNHKTVAGYQCDEYSGSGHMMMGEYTVIGCFSTAAPGAADYTAFAKALALKVKGTPMAGMASQPDGVPLELTSTTKMGNISIPGVPPEQAKALSEMMAKRPPRTSTTETTSIKAGDLPTDTFTVPAGFAKKEFAMPQMPMPGGGGPAAPKPPGGASQQ